MAEQQGAANRKPLLRTMDRAGRESGRSEDGGFRRGNHRRFGEFAGSTAAECATVCCCCPCAALDFLVLALYKVPAGLCRKAWRRNKRKRLLIKRRKMQASEGASTASSPAGAETEEMYGSHEEANSDEFETEMWGRFYRGGFWRSTSERED
ncbi:unnamed protein product [Cuscuta campestris]|uniref:Uncharacterized protein n=1 Tax=Cuscuta campestris TaxID=132261 RepID=A0A484NSI2_9ASTE|nr:unnamed protein product [Cuscuta campestris]